MTVYDNKQKNSPLMAVEFSPVAQGNLSFFYIDRPVQKPAIRSWLKDEVGQEIIAETKVGGHPVIVCRGEKTQNEIMELVAARGDKLTPHVEPKGFNFWKWRSSASVVGQSLQMLSAVTQVKPNEKAPSGWEHKGVDTPTLMFAVLNMSANVMGYMLGAQKSDDKHRLTYLKDQSNRKLEGHLQSGQELPAIEEKRADIRESRKPHKLASVGQQVKGFLQRNSVVVGEIGLRYAAAIGLVFPMLKDSHGHGGWKYIGENIAKGDFSKATWAKTLNFNKTMLLAGCGYLTGKALALFTKVKDPYEPKEHTWVDTMREDVLFKVGSLIEAGAGLVIAWNGFSHKNISFDKLNGSGQIKAMPDYAGGVGGIIFAIGYLIRLGAKFGEKKLNMQELQAHISDSLARTKPEEVPQLLADSAAAVKNHFNKEPLEFGKLYTQIATDLYRQNNIVFPLEGSPEERTAKMDTLTNSQRKVVSVSPPRHTAANHAQTSETVAPESSIAEVPSPSVQGEKIHVAPEMKIVHDQRPAASHVEHATREPQSQLGLSA